MKKLTLIAVLMLVTLSSAFAEENESEFLYGFLEGTYEVVGRWPNSDETYSGKVILSRNGGHLKVVRMIHGKEGQGTGNIETATADRVKVLRIHFSQGVKKYKATYLINSDLDNYGRLTGHVYLQHGKTKRPGLEALFRDHEALRK